MIEVQQLKRITNKDDLFLLKFIQPLNDTLEKYSIDTYLRTCHFLAQILHESGCFVYLKEIASGQAYEGRKDLGNTIQGDGVRFKGRGLIQVTGRSNYQSISNDLGIDFIKEPKLLETYKWATISAGWYWNKHNLNEWADKDDITTITKKINGGLNGIESRKHWLEKCIIELI